MIDMYTVCQRLILHEGLRLQPYFCSKNKLTIGVGRCIETNPFTAEEEKVIGDWRHGITKCAAIYLLQNDIKKIYKELKVELKFFKENREKYDVLVLENVAFVSFSNYSDGIRAMKANNL